MKKTDEIINKALEEINESSYYTGQQNGTQTPETMKTYEFAKDNVPTVNKLKNMQNAQDVHQYEELLPFPLHESVKHLADLYLKAEDYLSLCQQASQLPLFQGKEKDLEMFVKRMQFVMKICEQSAVDLQKFPLASSAKTGQ